MTITIIHNSSKVTTNRTSRPLGEGTEEDDAIQTWYRDREVTLIASLVSGLEIGDNNSTDLAPTLRRLYWQGPELPFPSPPIGLGRVDSYTTNQRVAVVQYALFNWAVTEQRQRYFARRSSENNLHTVLGCVPYCMDGYILPALATVAQVYDLVPASAIHTNQLATRCERPKEAVAAAVANRARREAEAEAYAAMQTTPTKTHAPLSPLRAKADDRDYLAKPLKFLAHGPVVPIGRQSNAALPAPGAERYAPPIESTVNIAVRISIPPAVIDDTIITFGEDLFKDAQDAPKFRNGDWICPCGTHNFGIRMQCIKLDCRTPKSVTVPAPAPVGPSRSALGDPGDWFCDFCGLCNWTRRTFCLRCCPLDVDNIEEAIVKGVVHFGDQIIDILRLGEKRVRALKKKPLPGAHCACFGPHHGTRCPQVGVGIDAQLWQQYTQAQGAILERIRSCSGHVNLVPMALPTKPTFNNHVHGGPRRG